MANLGLFGAGGGPFYDQNQLRIQNDQANATQNENLNTLMLKNQQQSAMNPMLLQAQDLANQTSQAQLPGIEGLSKSHAAQGNIAEAGTADTISGNSAEAKTKMGSEGLKQMATMGSMFSQMGSVVGQMPPGPHTTAMVQGMFGKLGIPDDSPIHKAILSTPPEKMGEVLSGIGKQMALASNSQIQMQANLATKGESAANVAGIKADSAEAIATAKNEATASWKQLDADTKLRIAEMGNSLRLELFKNKVINTDQLLAKREEEYRANPSQENKDELERVTRMKAFTNGAQGKLVEAYAKGDINEKMLGDKVAPNVRPNPSINPVQSFPASALPQPTPGAPTLPSAPVMAPVAPTAPAAQAGPTDDEIFAHYSQNPKYKGMTKNDILSAYRKTVTKR